MSGRPHSGKQETRVLSHRSSYQPAYRLLLLELDAGLPRPCPSLAPWARHRIRTSQWTCLRRRSHPLSKCHLQTWLLRRRPAPASDCPSLRPGRLPCYYAEPRVTLDYKSTTASSMFSQSPALKLEVKHSCRIRCFCQIIRRPRSDIACPSGIPLCLEDGRASSTTDRMRPISRLMAR